jgi:hypothetical protein
MKRILIFISMLAGIALLMAASHFFPEVMAGIFVAVIVIGCLWYLWQLAG